jgi:hypothetical protein
MPSFFDGMFAIAGVAAAAGPVIIHLLNRRRFRTVHWAAMDFLREAMQHSRRILQLRDLLLLLLRTACVLLFGLAMARPYFSSSGIVAGMGQPVHAVLVVDNSLSMGFLRLDGTLLNEAVTKTREFLDKLPSGSQITVLPLCGTPGQFSFEPYRTKEDALEALQAIHVVDRQGSAAQAIDLARQACHLAPDLPAKRVVFIGDQQSINWPADSLASQLAELPDLQIVQIAADDAENAWVSELRLQDGIADVESSTVFLATVRYQGRAARHDVQVTLTVDGVPVASRSVDLEPGQDREVTFPYRFDVAAEPGRAILSTASVSIPTDRLAEDDERSLVVPVVAALPVVFVDQYGGDEDPAQNRYGETFRLRRLLAPVTTRGDYSRQLIQVRHVKIDELNRQNLQDARLVVIAGVENPGTVVPLLREYVEQGGQLVIAAGGEFDPVAWQHGAWLDGRGILPAPLEPDFVGVRPDEAPNQLKPFFLDVTTLSNDWFQIDRASDEELADLYRLPIFFKAVAMNLGSDQIAKAVEDETERIAKTRAAAASTAKSSTETSSQAPSPGWLLWATQATSSDATLTPAELAQRTEPHAMAMFNNRLPFIVERQLGAGQIVFVASGVQSDWNTLTTTNAVLVFDRIFRSMLQQTLPVRNFNTTQQAVLPVEPQDRGLRFTLTRPKRPEEPLMLDALGGDLYGLTVNNMSDRGIYRVAAYRQESGTAQSAESKVWEIPLAADGPERESELQALNQAALAERAGGKSYRWVARSESIQLDGSQVRGQNLWKPLMAGVLACLLLELVVLSRPSWAGSVAK